MRLKTCVRSYLSVHYDRELSFSGLLIILFFKSINLSSLPNVTAMNKLGAFINIITAHIF